MAETQQDEDSTKLYRYVASGQLWELRNSSARPTFVNLSSDEPDATCRRWYLQAGSEALHVEVSHSFEADQKKTRFKLVDSEGARVWGLVFSSTAAFEAFHAQWNQCLYENTYHCVFRLESADKVSVLSAGSHALARLRSYPLSLARRGLTDCPYLPGALQLWGPGCRHRIGRSGVQARTCRTSLQQLWHDAHRGHPAHKATLLVQVQPASEHQRPSLTALASMPFSTAAQRDTPVLGLCLGSNTSFLLRDGQLDVMHNAGDGLQVTGGTRAAAAGPVPMAYGRRWGLP